MMFNNPKLYLVNVDVHGLIVSIHSQDIERNPNCDLATESHNRGKTVEVIYEPLRTTEHQEDRMNTFLKRVYKNK